MIEKIYDSVITILILVCEVAGTVIVFSAENVTIAVKILFWGICTLGAIVMWFMFMSIFGGEE